MSKGPGGREELGTDKAKGRECVHKQCDRLEGTLTHTHNLAFVPPGDVLVLNIDGPEMAKAGSLIVRNSIFQRKVFS